MFYNATGALMSRDFRQEPPAAGSLGFILVALVLIFTGLGYVADRWLHTKPWLMVAGVFVGAGLGFVYLVLVLFADSSGGRNRKESKNHGEGPDEGSS
jgi:F0F1-type ATP synthase assembly protein I